MKVRFFVYEFGPLELMTDLNPHWPYWKGYWWSGRELHLGSSPCLADKGVFSRRLPTNFFFPPAGPESHDLLENERTETSVSDVAGSAGAEAAFSSG